MSVIASDLTSTIVRSAVFWCLIESDRIVFQSAVGARFFRNCTHLIDLYRKDAKIMGKLQGKVAVITGATSGMALATARLFVEEGAYVFITGRRRGQLDQAVKAIGKNVTGVQGDASNLADLDRLYETVKKEKGRVDILFASAGAGELGPIGSITEEQFDGTFGLNVRGTLFTVQKALPLFNDAGSIILNGSIAGVKGFPSASVYSASKAAVRSFARTWTVDLKARNIRVNVLSPGTIDTPILEGFPKEAMDFFVSLIPRGKMGRPEEIATAALFLASSDSSFVTGIEMFVDGGAAQI
jgi:NAD(P)-dependent dehydrogenase (short-subunit alcohol dehydrogenase family)